MRGKGKRVRFFFSIIGDLDNSLAVGGALKSFPFKDAALKSWARNNVVEQSDAK